MDNKNENNFCVNCGAKLTEKMIFCENCGTKIPKNLEEDKIVLEEEKKVNTKLKGKKIINEEKNEIEDNVSEIKVENVEDIQSNIEVPNVQAEPKYSSASVLTDEVLNRKSDIKGDNTIIISIIIAIICTLCGVIFTIFYVNYKLDNSGSSSNSIISSGNKNVTITDTGIAEAVLKVYDSVVVVKNYVKGQLYSTGTGFVYKTDDKYAYILTNHHVVAGASDLKVVFTNNKEQDVQLVGSDEYSDIAVLKIDKKYIIATAIMGNSTDLRVGDTTFAVGAPLDSELYSWTVTRGILSGKDRLVEVGASQSSSSFVIKVLQTDTAINSGNSGGPLCNANGEVIGITNMKIASSQVEGMGFAIPIEEAIKYANKLMTDGIIKKPYLGISMYESANSYYSGGIGVYVADVESGSPADQAGLKKGDIITKMGDVDVISSAYLRYELYNYQIGDKITITYKRGNNTQKTTVVLGSSK